MRIENNTFFQIFICFCAKNFINIISKPLGTKNNNNNKKTCHDPFNVSSYKIIQEYAKLLKVGYARFFCTVI